MALDLVSDPGGLFRLIGAELNALKSLLSFAGDTNLTGASSLGDAATAIQTQYVSPHQDLGSDIWTKLENWRTTLAGPIQDIATRIIATTLARVDRDNPLSSLTAEAALDEIYRQMVSQTKTLDANAVSATAATVSATGDPMIVASLKLSDGRTAELVIPEVIDIIATNDQQTGGTLDAEEYSYAGEAARLPALAWNWPDGSGRSGTLTAIDAANTTATVNLLAGTGDFEDQTSNVPNDWAVFDGTAGTDILTETSVVYKGTKCVEFLGQASPTTPGIAYTLDTDNLTPGQVLHFAGKVRKTASVAAGVIKASLVNGSDAIIDDDQSVDLATTIAHGSISDSAWTTFSGSFVLPKTIPSTVKFVLEVSTAITDAESIYLDHFSWCRRATRFTSRTRRSTAACASRYTAAPPTLSRATATP